MMRRILGSLILALAALALLVGVDALRADPKTKPARVDEKIDSPASMEDLRIKQERMQRLFSDFKGALLRLSQRMAVSPRPEDREKSKVLKMAIEKANEEGIENSFDKLVAILKMSQVVELNNVEKALSENKDLTSRIRAILALLLTDNRDAELRAQREETQRRIEEIKRIIREQEIARTRGEFGKVGKDQLGKEQKKISDDTEALARGRGKGGPGGEGKQGSGKGEGKAGAGKGEGKNDTKDPKGDPKKDSSGGEQKPASSDSKGGQKGEGKGGSGSPKDGQKGEGKGGSGSPKDGQKSEGKGGGSGESKDGQKSDSKGKGDGKGEGKGDGKGG
jgi:hypothetical protein